MLKKIVLTVAILLLVAFPILSQEDEAIDFVEQAYTNLLELRSYSIEVEQVLNQSIMVGEGAIATNMEQQLSQQGTGQVNVETGETSMSLDQEFTVTFNYETGPQSVIVPLETDIIFVEDTLYMRSDDLRDGTTSLGLEDWIDFTHGTTGYSDAGSLNPELVTRLATTPTLYALNAETIDEVIEHSSELVDGRLMRVFDVMMEFETLSEYSFGSLTGLYYASGNRVDAASHFMESISLKLRLWITNENRLIHRVESSEVVSANLSAEMMGGIPGTLSQQTTIRSTLSNFNEPVEIEAPELAE